MYRTRTKQSAKRQAAIEARAGIPVMPVLRRQIIIIDHDFGTVEHRIDLFRTNRIDCYSNFTGAEGVRCMKCCAAGAVARRLIAQLQNSR